MRSKVEARASLEPLSMERAQRRIGPEERERIEEHNRSLRQDDILGKRLVFESGPYEAFVGFSNYCNMSCIMCWDGANPPLVKMPPEVLAKLGEQIAPFLSVITPHNASEPLIVTWEDTRRIAEQCNIRLSLTTNVQFLDEDRFYELKDITETLHLSIDSHIWEIYEKIRPGSKPDQVFANLESTARLCSENGIDCVAQVVLLMENAPTMPETTAYFADIGIPTVNVIQLIDMNGRSGLSDPLLHFSSEYIDYIKDRCIEVAREKKVCLRWLNREGHDFREQKIEVDPRKLETVRWEDNMSYYAPGYCSNAYGRLRIDADGEVAPCCCATDGDLVLGRLAEQDFPEIWNGPNAQDLRRGMLTWDYASLCSTCCFVDTPPPRQWLPFIDTVKESRAIADLEPSLELAAPEHLTRSGEAPLIRLQKPDQAISEYLLVLSLGGGLPLYDQFQDTGLRQADHLETVSIAPRDGPDGIVELVIPEMTWERLRSNLGYWWTVLAVCDQSPRLALRPPEINCLIRHEDIDRVQGSTLRYPDKDGLPVVDLGRAKEIGWTGQRALPSEAEARRASQR